MRQLWINFDAVVASWRDRPLFVQRLWTVPQDEQRHQPTSSETSSSTGGSHFFSTLSLLTRFLHLATMRVDRWVSLYVITRSPIDWLPRSSSTCSIILESFQMRKLDNLRIISQHRIIMKIVTFSSSLFSIIWKFTVRLGGVCHLIDK